MNNTGIKKKTPYGIFSVVVLVILVQIFQTVGSHLSARVDKRVGQKARKSRGRQQEQAGPEG